MKRDLVYFRSAILFATLIKCSLCELPNENIKLKEGVPQIRLSYGILSGIIENSRNGRPFYSFLGVPYANPPKRFEAPSIFNQKWDDVRPANEFGPQCAQLAFFNDIKIGDENCLFSNIYIPENPLTKEPLPVLVWIHGGAFKFGSSDDTGPKYFMDQDVIIVTINYRLGALGFLSTEDELVPGNNGLRDQMTALQWVQKNIEAFGGDPNRVTIFGISAGSASVHHLVLSPLTKGLFQNAICLSGTAFDPWTIVQHPLQNAKNLGNSLNCPDVNEELVQCLKNQDVEDILRHSEKLLKWGMDPMVIFAPTVEKTDKEKALIPDTPENLIKTERFNKVPIIIGITKDEGISLKAAPILANEVLTQELNDEWNTYAPLTFIYEDLFKKEDLQEISAKIRKFYFDDKDVNVNTRENLTNIYSDALFVYGAHKAASAHTKYGPTYLYLYTYSNEFSITNLFVGPENFGTTHGDDLHMYFTTELLGPEIIKDSKYYKFSENMVRLWASFATEGKPKQIWGDMTSWEPLRAEQSGNGKRLPWFVLDEKTSVLEDPFSKRLQFWDELIRDYRHDARKDEL